MNAIRYFPILLLVLIVSAYGCSSSGNSPILPDDTTQGIAEIPASLDRQESGEAYAGSHQLWGLYIFKVSDDLSSVEIVPVRNAQQHFNVLFYLESAPCTDCVQVVGQAPQGGGVIDFDIRIEHPFVGNKYFTGFDVRGIGIFSAHGTFPVQDLKYSIGETGDGEILNADGYTHLYHVATYGSGNDGLQGYVKGSMSSPQSPDGTLNAYKNIYTSSNRNFLAAGDVKIVTYRVKRPVGPFIFGYAVDANWAIPENKPVEIVPDDFGMNANSPEAWQVSVTVGDGLFTDGGEADVEVWVYDWQGFATIDTVKLEAPDLLTALKDATFDSMGGDYVVYKTTISNDLGSGEGTYDMLIAVEDTANANAPDYLDLTAYQIVEVNVAEGVPNNPPVPVVVPDKTDVVTGEEITFDASTSYDPDDDDIELWEWELDNTDGINFDYDDIQGLDEQIVQWSYDEAGTYYVNLKIWDTPGASGVLADPIEITVEADPCFGHTPDCKLTVGDDAPNIDVQVKFTDISTDPDGFGDLAYYEWDFTGGAPPDYDPTYSPDSKEVFYSYTEGGDFYVYHRTWDNANCNDDLDEPFLIEVNGPPVASAEANFYEISAGMEIEFSSLSADPGIGDPDGNGPIPLGNFEWDFSYEDENFQVDDTGPVVYKIFEAPGTYTIQHRVEDEKGLDDMLDTAITINVNALPDVVVHLSEEQAMNPVGAEYVFYNYFGSVGGTSKINYLDFDGPWDFTELEYNGTFYQDIVSKNDAALVSYNSNWPSVQYYVRQYGPSSLSGTMTEGFGATARDFTSPPLDGDQYTYGIIDMSSGGEVVKFSPWNILTWPLDKYTNQYDDFSYSALSVQIDCEIWATGLGQGIAYVDVEGVPTPFYCVLLKVRQRDEWDSGMGIITLGDTVSYRWIADDGTEIAAITAMNAYMNPDNWNVGSGIITGSGGMRWLDYYDLDG